MRDPDESIGRDLFDGDPGSPLAHLYRGEIHRMKLWRERLDRTTYWAVTVMAAILTWAFSSGNNPHYVILVGYLMLGVFLLIEARRFRGYDIWRSRVRTLQENVFALALWPEEELEAGEWRKRLAEDYRSPEPKISTEEAVAHRLRRVYLLLFGVLLTAWTFRVTAFEGEAWPATAAVGKIPGTVVTVVVLLTLLASVVVAFRPREWHVAGEVTEERTFPWKP